MLIKANNLTKRYGTKLALDNVNLQIDRGQLIAYLGTNGAGKSTTIKNAILEDNANFYSLTACDHPGGWRH